MVQMASHALALLLGGLLVAAPPTERWGTLRQVLRHGETEARVALSDLERPNAVGLGALAGLQGEVVVVDGEAWVSVPTAHDRTLTRRATLADQATFAVVSQVAAWTEHELDADLSADALAAEVARLGVESGFDADGVFPFVVEGRFRSVDIHVLNGACPMAGAEPLADDVAPRRVHRTRGRGLLVGFHSGEGPGVVTHHGSSTHVHALLDGRVRLGGHVDGVVVRAGSVLKLPAAEGGGATRHD